MGEPKLRRCGIRRLCSTMRVRNSSCILLGAFLSACATSPPSKATSDQRAFLRAIEDAALPEESEIATDLWRIDETNLRLRWRTEERRELLVVKLMKRGTFERWYPPAGQTAVAPTASTAQIWVTPAPQLQEFCSALSARGAPLRTRVAQHLGLPASAAYDTIVELWVQRTDLFRPCPNPDPSQRTCDLDAPHDDVVVPGIPDYPTFFDLLYASSYHRGGAPWTRLGYTFDWGSSVTEIGASELIIAPEASYSVEAVRSVDDYCAGTQDQK